MKIVFLAPFGVRPKGTVIARMLPLATALQQQGHRVTIIAPPYTNPEDSGKSEILDGVLLKNVTLGLRHKALAAPSLAWQMFRETLAEQPDLVHLFKPKGYGGLAAMLHLALQTLGVRLPPLFLDTDDWEGDGGMNELHPYSSPEKRFYRFQEQWLTPRAVGVTVASRGLERMVGELGVPAKRVLYLPNCVGEPAPGNGAAVRQRLGIEAATPVLLLYTRFFEFGQERLYRIFKEIRRRVPGVMFLVVGKGRRGEEALLLEAGREGGFLDALVMAGWVEPASLPDYLAAGDVALYPLDDTLVNRCKCPAKLTELLLAGVCVVADGVGQANEYIQPGCSGMLTDPGDWQGMADASAGLLLDAGRRRLLGENGRSFLLEGFRWQSHAANLINFYGEHANR